MANIRVEVNPNKIASGIKGKWGSGLYKLCSVIRQDCNRYVRIDKGTLRKSSYSASQPGQGTDYLEHAIRQTCVLRHSSNHEERTCKPAMVRKGQGQYMDKWRKNGRTNDGGSK